MITNVTERLDAIMSKVSDFILNSSYVTDDVTAIVDAINKADEDKLKSALLELMSTVSSYTLATAVTIFLTEKEQQQIADKREKDITDLINKILDREDD